MRKVVLYHLLSLDGVSLEDHSDWFVDSGPEMFANLGRIIGSQDDILLGRVTYDSWAGVLADVGRRAVRQLHQRNP